jgi:hypothetical protein
METWYGDSLPEACWSSMALGRHMITPSLHWLCMKRLYILASQPVIWIMLVFKINYLSYFLFFFWKKATGKILCSKHTYSLAYMELSQAGWWNDLLGGLLLAVCVWSWGKDPNIVKLESLLQIWHSLSVTSLSAFKEPAVIVPPGTSLPVFLLKPTVIGPTDTDIVSS